MMSPSDGPAALEDSTAGATGALMAPIVGDDTVAASAMMAPAVTTRPLERTAAARGTADGPWLSSATAAAFFSAVAREADVDVVRMLVATACAAAVKSLAAAATAVAAALPGTFAAATAAAATAALPAAHVAAGMDTVEAIVNRSCPVAVSSTPVESALTMAEIVIKTRAPLAAVPVTTHV